MKLYIVGSVGLPPKYGGFETLVDQLVKYSKYQDSVHDIFVFCSSFSYSKKITNYNNAKLLYIPLPANGIMSVLYDTFSLFYSIYRGCDVILLLGTSGSLALPFVRLISDVKIITNIDGMEWKRSKWGIVARAFLRFTEYFAIKFSHSIISDNKVIQKYITTTYSKNSSLITYGGDQTLKVGSIKIDSSEIPNKYAFSVCRIEPENNIHIIVESFINSKTLSLVIVGNWNNSNYGRNIFSEFSHHKSLLLLDPIYDIGKLKTLRNNMYCYVHGHSAGGTNPALVEAMHFGKPVLAFDCDYNRSTTDEKALYFNNSESLSKLVNSLDLDLCSQIGSQMSEIATRRYTWTKIARKYFDLIGNVN